MKSIWVFLLLCTAGSAAAGDADLGAREFLTCKACHSVIAADGQPIVRGGKVGPNLFGVIGRTAGTDPGFTYSSGLKAMGQAGLVWTQELLAEYVKNPTAFIDTHGGEGNSRMAFRYPRGGDNIAAYLASLP